MAERNNQKAEMCVANLNLDFFLVIFATYVSSLHTHFLLKNMAFTDCFLLCENFKIKFLEAFSMLGQYKQTSEMR